MKFLKDIAREILISCHIDLTKNIKYDRLTRKILKDYLKENYNCIDIGCHKGEILDFIFKYSPKGSHYAFEPIPYLFDGLKKRFDNIASVYPYALSDNAGKTEFQLVKNAPAYSGIKKRRYDISNPEIEQIEVEMKTLDSIIPTEEKIHFVKIDVEGAEMGVMKGAVNLLKSNKPVILFEFGKGASDYYGTTPTDMYDFLSEEIGLNIYTLSDYIKNQKSMSLDKFKEYFDSNDEYYFVAR